MHGLRDSFGTWVYETYGVKQAQEWLGHGDPATTLRHYVRLTTAARAKAVAGLDEVTRPATPDPLTASAPMPLPASSAVTFPADSATNQRLVVPLPSHRREKSLQIGTLPS